MTTLHLIVPDLLGRTGHHYIHVLEIERAARARGWSVACYVPRGLNDRAFIEELHGVEALAGLLAREFSDPVVEIGAANLRFYLDMAALGADRFGRDDIVFLMLLHHRNADGFVKWLSEAFDNETRPHFAAIVRGQECFVGNTQEIHNRNSALLGRAMQWAAERSTKCRRLFAFSAAHLPHLRMLAGPMAVLDPFPFIAPSLTPTEREPSDTIRFGYFGSSSWEQKGLPQMLGVARQLVGTPNFRFTIQIDLAGETYGAAAIVEAHRDLLAHPAVRVIRGGLSFAEYVVEHTACDVTVLPYGPGYERHESGLVHEAAALGIPVVLPACSVANRRLLEAGIGMPVFEVWSVEAIASACRQAAASRTRLAAAMRAGADILNKGLTAQALLDQLDCMTGEPTT